MYKKFRIKLTFDLFQLLVQFIEIFFSFVLDGYDSSVEVLFFLMQHDLTVLLVSEQLNELSALGPKVKLDAVSLAHQALDVLSVRFQLSVQP